MSDYDAAKDSHDSYFAAIEAKRLRGDTHGWDPAQQSMFEDSHPHPTSSPVAVSAGAEPPCSAPATHSAEIAA